MMVSADATTPYPEFPSATIVDSPDFTPTTSSGTGTNCVAMPMMRKRLVRESCTTGPPLLPWLTGASMMIVFSVAFSPATMPARTSGREVSQILERRDDDAALRFLADDHTRRGVEALGPQGAESDDGDVAAIVCANRSEERR